MEKLKNVTVTDIKDIITIESAQGKNINIVNRETYGLSFCMSGKITYSHNGKEFISNTGYAVFLPQGQSYSLYCNKSGLFPLINFKCENELYYTIKVFPIKNSEAYIKDYERIKELSLFEGNRAKILSVFYNIIYRMYSQSRENSTLSPAIRYIEENYNNPELTNKILAKQCCISEVYFRKLFTKEYKVSPRQFIIDIRINRAKQLLADGIFKINYISKECGFSNPYHFCRIFKDKTGFTPTEYIKQNKIFQI